MQIIVPHDKGQQEAIHRLDEAVDRLLTSQHSGVRISDGHKNWEGSTMNLSARIGTGFVNILVAAKLLVEDRQVVVDCDLPPFVRQFVPEDKIRTGVDTRIRELLES